VRGTENKEDEIVREW